MTKSTMESKFVSCYHAVAVLTELVMIPSGPNPVRIDNISAGSLSRVM